MYESESVCIYIYTRCILTTSNNLIGQSIVHMLNKYTHVHLTRNKTSVNTSLCF